MELKEILLEEEFCKIQQAGAGFIAITDGNKCRIHSAMCPNIDLYYFRTKVIDNNRKNGNYYWSTDISSLKDKMNNSEECLHCNHLYGGKVNE